MTIPEQSRLDTMEDKLTAVEQKIDRVLVALVGDNLNIDKGLVPEFKTLRERLDKLEAKANRVLWMAVGAGIGGGISLSTIIKWIQDSAILSK